LSGDAKFRGLVLSERIDPNIAMTMVYM